MEIPYYENHGDAATQEVLKTPKNNQKVAVSATFSHLPCKMRKQPFNQPFSVV